MRRRDQWRRFEIVLRLAEEVRRGLSESQKSLPCRFLYDEIGSSLFEQICEVPEYYVTRAERSILQEHSEAIIEMLPNDTALVELGSGSAEKTQLLREESLEPRSGGLGVSKFG